MWILDVHSNVKNLKAKTKLLLLSSVLISSAGGLGFALIGTAQAVSPVTVTQANPQGWAFFDDNGNGGSGSFVNGPGTPPLGSGSAQLTLTASNQGYAFGKSAYGGTKLSSITKLSYSTYVQQGNNTVAPALQLNIDSDVTDSNTAWQGRLVYEPYYTHTVTDGTWQTWNTQDNSTQGGNGNWWFSNGTLASSTGCSQATPCTWSSVISKLPNAGIDSGANQGVVFKAGSNWAVPFTGNIDNFTIGLNGTDTVYNFDEQNCLNVNTSRGPLTAAQVGGNVSGDLDAHGCDIAVYYDHNHQGQVKNASIHDANQFGVFADGLNGNVEVNVNNSHIYNVGNHTAGVYTPNGVQTGVGIYYNTYNYQNNNQPTSGRVNGEISNSQIDSYQKGGIVLNGVKTNAEVENNVVTGAGPVNYIAQNGVEVLRGADSRVTNNTIAGNAYTGSNEATSAGVLTYGGYAYGVDSPDVTGVIVYNNKLIDNDVAINFADYNHNTTGQGPNGPASTPTRDVANNNWIFSSAITNTTGLVGNNGAFGYQAGIEDVGNQDSACHNTILGPGYVEQGSFDYSTNTVTPGSNNAVVRKVDAGYTFPTTNFRTCEHGNYDNGNFNRDYFKDYDSKFDHNWSF